MPEDNLSVHPEHCSPFKWNVMDLRESLDFHKDYAFDKMSLKSTNFSN